MKKGVLLARKVYRDRMSIKKKLRRLLPPWGFEIVMWLGAKVLRLSYLCRGRVPWSRGYSQYKARFLRRAMANDDLLHRFRHKEALPVAYGVGLDERCIEYPWLLSHLSSEEELLLDAGSILNLDYVIEHPCFAKKEIHILTLAPEPDCFWKKGISYVYADLRNIPIRDSYYDSVICLSTLEHIGRDNTLYTGTPSAQGHSPDDLLTTIAELRRVLKPGGTLFLSVPFGRYGHFDTFQQFDRKLLSRAIEAFNSIEEPSEDFYRYSPAGWQIAKAEDCADCQYVQRLAAPRGQTALFRRHSRVEKDRAAAARAVACIRLVKR